MQIFTPLFPSWMRPVHTGLYLTANLRREWEVLHFSNVDRYWTKDKLIVDDQNLDWIGFTKDAVEKLSPMYFQNLLTQLNKSDVVLKNKIKVMELEFELKIQRMADQSGSKNKRIASDLKEITELKNEIALLRPPPPRSNSGPGRYKATFVWVSEPVNALTQAY